MVLGNRPDVRVRRGAGEADIQAVTTDREEP